MTILLPNTRQVGHLRLFRNWKEDIKGSQGQGTQVVRADIQFKSRVYVLFI